MLSRTATVLTVVLLTGLSAFPAAAEVTPPEANRQLRHDAAGGSAPGELSMRAASVASAGCPGEVTEDTTLAADCSGGLSISTDNVTLDLGGHTVRSISVYGNDATVRNGTIRSPGSYAIWVEGADVLLEDLEVVESGGPWAIESGPRTVIRGGMFRDNEIVVSQYYNSPVILEDNRFVANWMGISVQSGRGAIVEGNRFEDNTIGVNIWDEDWIAASDTRVANNRFSGNAVGVRVDGMADASGTVVENNRFHRSGASAVLVTTAFGPGSVWSWWDNPGGGADAVIRRNTITHSGNEPQMASGCLDDDEGLPECETDADDGITVLSLPDVAGTMILAHNRVIKSAGYGIEAPGVTDGGGNVAPRNDAGGCLGVVCR